MVCVIIVLYFPRQFFSKSGVTSYDAHSSASRTVSAVSNFWIRYSYFLRKNSIPEKYHYRYR